MLSSAIGYVSANFFLNSRRISKGFFYQKTFTVFEVCSFKVVLLTAKSMNCIIEYIPRRNLGEFTSVRASRRLDVYTVIPKNVFLCSI